MSAAPVEHERSRAFWTGLVLGLAVTTYGIAGLLASSAATNPPKAAEWLAGADVLHDAAFVPIVLTTGWLVARAPRPLRWPLRASLIGTALVLAVGWIPLRGYRRLRDNPSLAPLDYGAAVVALIVAVWCVGALWTAVNLVTARRARRARRVDGADG